MTLGPRAFRLTPAPPAGASSGDPSPGRDGATPAGPATFGATSGGPVPVARQVRITEEPLDAIEAADGVPVLPPPSRNPPWLALLLSALGGLATLAIGLGVERLVSDLFAAAPWLGWVAVALAALAAVALLAIVSREMRGVWRERRIERLRQSAADALAVRNHEGAKGVAREVAALYAGREVRAFGPRVADVDDEIMDAEDRLALAERTLLAPLDADAKRAIAATAKQVAGVTALSPRAIVDVMFVIYAAAKLLRRVARIYGGRPGLIGGLRLARAALNHLAVTGSVAVGDSLIQQALGLGIAARVSAKLGEGVLNGLMTARFGLAALEVCRPLPFIREEPPRIGDVAGELLSRGDDPAAARGTL
jgi:putative membrane protein